MAGFLISELPGGEVTSLGANDLLTLQKSGETLLKRIKWSTLQGLQIPSRLGPTADNTLTDFNAAIQNGWYILPSVVGGGVNGPGSAASPFAGSTTTPYYVQVTASGDYVMQHAYAQQGGGVPGQGYIDSFSRVKYAGVWQGWHQIVPTFGGQLANWAGPRILGSNGKLITGIIKNREEGTSNLLQTWFVMDTVTGDFVDGLATYTLAVEFPTAIRVVMAQAAMVAAPLTEAIFVYPTVLSKAAVQITAKKANLDLYSGALSVTLFMMGN